MKWIKASVRLPVFSAKLISRFIHSKTPLFDFKQFSLNNSEKLDQVEWLDETPEQSFSREEVLSFMAEYGGFTQQQWHHYAQNYSFYLPATREEYESFIATLK